jgi:hypothetical protein
LLGEAAFIEGLFFPDGPIVVAIGPKGGGAPTKSLNDFRQGGGDVWYPLESGHQGGGNGVLGKSAYTSKRTLLGSQLQPGDTSVACYRASLDCIVFEENEKKAPQNGAW